MIEDNSGTIGVGQRLSNIEGMLKEALEQIATERHRVNNLLAEKTLSQRVLEMVNDHESRITEMEKRDIADEAVARALEEYQTKQRATFRWGIGLVSSIGIVNILVQYIHVGPK